MWYQKQQADKDRIAKQMEIEEKRQVEMLADKQKDREVKIKELELKDRELELQKVEAEHRHRREIDELKLQQDRFQLEKEERSAMINTQNMILKLLEKKLN